MKPTLEQPNYPAERAAWVIFTDRANDACEAKKSLEAAKASGMDGRTRKARGLKGEFERLNVRGTKATFAIARIIRRLYPIK